MARGIALIAAAVLLGIILLNATDAPEPLTVSSDESPEEDSGSEAGDDTTTTTTVPPATDTTPPAGARPPAEVTVLVANGARVQGAASKLSTEIATAGFTMAAPANTAPVPTSTVLFAEGYEADAQAVAALLAPVPPVAPMPDPAPVEDLRGAQVVVVQGPDLAS